MSAQNQDNDEVLARENIARENKEGENTAQEKLEDSHAGEEKLESPEKNADSLEAQLESAQQKASENWEMFLRAKAEMDNLRRRNSKDLENAHKFGTEKFVTELLPVLDSMAMGLAVEEASAESLREGMELTMNMLGKMMEKLGIEEIDPLNEKFDADKHQAMTTQPSADVEANTVIAVMQKGYLLNERLIRPAMVIVSKEA
jgi:molecular chaperone GrpE